jgi:uncharacterized protein YndB with AHSA1/START domain
MIMIMSTSTSRVVICAPVNQVWKALTEPEFVKQWQYGSDLITDWQPGHAIRFHSLWEGKVYEQWGQVVEVTTNRLIKYTLFAPGSGLDDMPENYFTMTYELEESDGSTTLRVIQMDPRGTDSQESQDGAVENENGVLTALKDLVERMQ